MGLEDANAPLTFEETRVAADDQSESVRPDAAQATVGLEPADAKSAGGTDDAVDEEAVAEPEERATESDSTSPCESANGGAAISVTAKAQPGANADADGRCDIEKQPFDFDHCTVQVAIQLMPDDGDPNGRPVVVGVRSHLDAPILRMARLKELGPMPQMVSELLDALRGELPARERAAVEARERKKEESEKPKAAPAKSSSTRGKRTRTVVSTVPAATGSSSATNRPRPEAPASTAPQQQMGLF